MGIAMNMNSNTMQRELLDAEYDDEVLYAGWIAEDSRMCLLQPFVSADKPTTMPADIVMLNVDLFMQRMYAYQR